MVKEQEDLEIRGQVETSHTTAFLRSDRIKKSLGDLKRLTIAQTPVQKTSANTGVKSSQKRKIISEKNDLLKLGWKLARCNEQTRICPWNKNE